MSANQAAAGAPKIADDVFGFASLLIYIFTGLSPVRWEKGDSTHLQQGLAFFLQDPHIAEIIAKQYMNARSEESAQIEAPLSGFKQQLIDNQPFYCSSVKPSRCDYTGLIQKGVDGLAASEILDINSGWVETTLKPDQSPSPDFVPHPGNLSLFNGTAGILYQLSFSQQLGFSTESCSTQINHGVDLLKNVLSTAQARIPGLLYGATGLRVVLNGNWLQENAPVPNQPLDIELGLAGELLALLQLPSTSLPSENSGFVKNSLATIINTQLPTGFWPLFLQSEKDILLGIDKGVAGILLVLLRYAEIIPEAIPAKTFEKGLNALKKKMHKGLLPVSTKSREANMFSLLVGTPGMALVFLRAYRLTNNPAYKIAAEKLLGVVPARPNYVEHSLAFGLAGLGEVYLEAAAILGQEEWQSRADWLAQFFYHTWHHSSNGGCHWVVDKRSAITPGFMNGTCGILHFLTRYLYPDQVKFPIF